MAYYKTGGGALNETELWTNPSPTTNMGETSLNLNQSFLNFKYLKIEYRYTTADSTSTHVIFPTELVDSGSRNLNSARALIGAYVNSNTLVARGFYTDENVYDVIKITGGRRVKNTSGDLNNVAIPTKISGLK